MAIPDELYRVFDDSSTSQYDEQDGFVAGNSHLRLKMSRHWSEWQKDMLIEALDNHLDWYNRNPTPFISVYSSKSAAYASANGRINDGKMGVIVAYIDGSKLFRGSLRKVWKLAEELGYYIPDKALDNSKSEWIVLQQIPSESVHHLQYMN